MNYMGNIYAATYSCTEKSDNLSRSFDLLTPIAPITTTSTTSTTSTKPATITTLIAPWILHNLILLPSRLFVIPFQTFWELLPPACAFFLGRWWDGTVIRWVTRLNRLAAIDEFILCHVCTAGSSPRRRSCGGSPSSSIQRLHVGRTAASLSFGTPVSSAPEEEWEAETAATGMS